MNNNYSLISKYINAAKSIALVCHVNPDGDTLGSANALRIALGDKAEIICSDPVPAKYTYMKIQKFNISEDFDYELYIFIDCSSKFVVGSIYDKIPVDTKKITIDHHKTNELDSDVSLIDANRSSTAEIVFDLLEYMKLDISCEMAESLYTGLITDNGMFSYGYTTPEAHITASKLLALGVDFQSISNRHFRTRTYEQTMLIKETLSHIKIYDDIAISYLTIMDLKKYNADINGTESLVNFLIEIDKINIAIFLKQIYKNEYKVSFRSQNSFDVSVLAGFFGGGGHAQAAGCTIKLQNIEQLTELVLDRVKKIRAS